MSQPPWWSMDSSMLGRPGRRSSPTRQGAPDVDLRLAGAR
jgi:hypothetical protein